jgi:selenide,water dikinase
MALGSGVVLEIDVASVPTISGALDAVRMGAIPAGLLANRDFAECLVADAPGSAIPDELRTLIYDPQTAGGLLISVAADSAPDLLASLRASEVPAERIGSVTAAVSATSAGPAIVLR